MIFIIHPENCAVDIGADFLLTHTHKPLFPYLISFLMEGKFEILIDKKFAVMGCIQYKVHRFKLRHYLNKGNLYIPGIGFQNYLHWQFRSQRSPMNNLK